MVEMLEAMREAKASGAFPEQLVPLHDLQKKAMWRLDYISSETPWVFMPIRAVQVLKNPLI